VKQKTKQFKFESKAQLKISNFLLHDNNNTSLC